MGRLMISADVQAPLDAVFAYVDDHTNVTKYMRDVTRWEPTGVKNHGKGAQFEVAMKAGPTTIDSVVDITDWAENRLIGWRSVTGLKQSGMWRFSGRGAFCSVSLEMEFELPGGFAGRVLSRAAEPAIRHNLERSVQQLKAQAEVLAAAKPASVAARASGVARASVAVSKTGHGRANSTGKEPTVTGKAGPRRATTPRASTSKAAAPRATAPRTTIPKSNGSTP